MSFEFRDLSLPCKLLYFIYKSLTVDLLLPSKLQTLKIFHETQWSSPLNISKFYSLRINTNLLHCIIYLFWPAIIGHLQGI